MMKAYYSLQTLLNYTAANTYGCYNIYLCQCSIQNQIKNQSLWTWCAAWVSMSFMCECLCLKVRPCVCVWVWVIVLVCPGLYPLAMRASSLLVSQRCMVDVHLCQSGSTLSLAGCNEDNNQIGAYQSSDRSRTLQSTTDTVTGQIWKTPQPATPLCSD